MRKSRKWKAREKLAGRDKGKRKADLTDSLWAWNRLVSRVRIRQNDLVCKNSAPVSCGVKGNLFWICSRLLIICLVIGYNCSLTYDCRGHQSSALRRILCCYIFCYAFIIGKYDLWALKISYLNWINLYNVISVQMIVNCHITVSSVFSRPLTDFT